MTKQLSMFESDAELPSPPARKAFDGKTYDPNKDHKRLRSQLALVHGLMLDGEWRTLRQIADSRGGSEASISARLRDLRKPKYGSHVVERRRVSGGLYEYRLVRNQKCQAAGEDRPRTCRRI